MSRTRRRLLGLLAATLLVLATIPLSAFGSSHEGFLDSTGGATLTLETGDETLTVTFQETGKTAVTLDQALRKPDKCVVDAGRFSSLVGIALDGGGEVGLVSNGLGSTDGKNCSSGNGRVEDGQGLTITMPHGWIATGALLDVEGKFGASLDVTPIVNGVDGTTKQDIALNTDVNSDNGADSGASDNTTVDLDDVTSKGESDGEDLGDFTAIRLSPRSTDGRGEISLEGGGDDSSLGPTVFTLSRFYQYSLDCGDVISPDFTSDANPGSALGAVLLRYDTTDKYGGTCAPIGIDLWSDGDGVTLDNTDTDEFGTLQAPNLRLVLTWRVELKDADGNPRPMDGPDGVYAELDRQVDLLDDSVPQSSPYCLADNDVDGSPQPATQPDDDTTWCLLSDSTELFDGYLVQTQVYDGARDPRFF